MKTRDWEEYLSSKFAFPFMAIRIDDADKVVWEGKQTRFIPILDLEVIDTKGMNKQYFEEYAEWFANE